MRARGKVVGVLSAMSYRAHTFTPHDVAVLTAIADQVGVALDNARLYEVESRRNAHLALINEIARQVTATLDLADSLGRTLRKRFSNPSVTFTWRCICWTRRTRRSCRTHSPAVIRPLCLSAIASR